MLLAEWFLLVESLQDRRYAIFNVKTLPARVAPRGWCLNAIHYLKVIVLCAPLEISLLTLIQFSYGLHMIEVRRHGRNETQ